MVDSTLDDKQLLELLENGAYDELRRRLAHTDPADLADILELLDPEEVKKVFAVLDNDYASDVIVEMDPNEVEDVVDRMSPKRIAEMIAEMAPDDAADFCRELSEDEQSEVISLLAPEQREKISKLLNYEEDSGGDLMTPELCALSAEKTVQEAINAIANTDFADPISMIFAVDDQSRLLGSINISDLLAEKRNAKLKDIIDREPVVAKVDHDQEEIAQAFRKYDLYVMPVVDDDGKLVGRITADDIMDVLHEEAREDMAHIAGAPDIEQKALSPLKVVRLRLPWLMITMCTGMIISVIIQKMTGLTSVEGLAAFVPVIMAMGGNTGMQASAVTVRSIALGEIELSKLLDVFGREICVGIMMGLVCGLVTATIVWVNLNYFHETLTQSPLKMALIVALSMGCAMTFAAFAGTLLPILLHRFKIDPAVASGPFVTTGNDLSASLIYFAMCYFLLKA